jgi:group I intron endonuclease
MNIKDILKSSIKITKTSGIYLIYSIFNDKGYIGQSCNIQRRKIDHLSKLRRNVHSNTYLQNSFNKYGENNLIFLTIEVCMIERLNEREEYWINSFNKDDLFNIINGGTVSDKDIARLRISKSHKGKVGNQRKLSEEKVNELRQKHIDGERIKKLSIDYKIPGSTVTRIVQGKKYINGNNIDKKLVNSCKLIADKRKHK